MEARILLQSLFDQRAELAALVASPHVLGAMWSLCLLAGYCVPCVAALLSGGSVPAPTSCLTPARWLAAAGVALLVGSALVSDVPVALPVSFLGSAVAWAVGCALGGIITAFVTGLMSRTQALARRHGETSWARRGVLSLPLHTARGRSDLRLFGVHVLLLAAASAVFSLGLDAGWRFLLALGVALLVLGSPAGRLPFVGVFRRGLLRCERRVWLRRTAAPATA